MRVPIWTQADTGGRAIRHARDWEGIEGAMEQAAQPMWQCTTAGTLYNASIFAALHAVPRPM